MVHSTRQSDGSATAASEAREQLLTGKTQPPLSGQLGAGGHAKEVPRWLRQAKRWTAWNWFRDQKDGRWKKVPQHWDGSRFQPGFSPAKADHLSSLQDLDSLLKILKRIDPNGNTFGLLFVPGADDSGDLWGAVDLDNINPQSLPGMLLPYISAGYWCKSPSGYGIRVIGKVPAGSRSGQLKDSLDGELFLSKSCTVTAIPIDGTTPDNSPDLSGLWSELQRHVPERKKVNYTFGESTDPLDSDPEWMAFLLERAKNWIDAADGAVAGSNGHNAFFRICCKVAGGFGLRGPEGLALVQDWNQNKCSPPFDERDLEHKWQDALRNTEGEMPEKRQQALEAWQSIQRKTAGYTYKDEPKKAPKAKAAGKAKADPASPPADEGDGEEVTCRRTRDGRWVVVVDKDKHEEVRQQVCRTLGQQIGVRLYNRAGRAAIVADADCQIDWEDPETGKVIKRGPERRAVILPAGNGHLISILSKHLAFRRVKQGEDGKRKLKTADIPHHLLPMVKDVPEGLKPLRGLLHGPTYDAATDRVICQAGYHPSLGVELTASLNLDTPKKCSLEDAKAAAQRILNLYRYFPWPDPVDGNCIQRGRLLVAMVTALLRHEFGPCPAVMIRARMAGSGKTEISKSIGEVVHGDQPRLMPWVTGRSSEEELRKRFVGLLDGGETFTVIDNVPAGWSVDSPCLNALLTSKSMYDRELGQNKAGAQVGGPNHLFLVMTGNNIEATGDFGERCLPIDLAATPENRRKLDPSRFEGIGDLGPYVRANRATILNDLMVILRAYNQAGRPVCSTTYWGSFAEWHAACVQPVAFALGFDPLAGIHDQWHEHDNEGDALAGLAVQWLDRKGGQSLSAAEMKNAAAGIPEWELALVELCLTESFASLNPRTLGKRLKAFAGRPIQIREAMYEIRTGTDHHAKVARFSLVRFSGRSISNYSAATPPNQPRQTDGLVTIPPETDGLVTILAGSAGIAGSVGGALFGKRVLPSFSPSDASTAAVPSFDVAGWQSDPANTANPAAIVTNPSGKSGIVTNPQDLMPADTATSLARPTSSPASRTASDIQATIRQAIGSGCKGIGEFRDRYSQLGHDPKEVTNDLLESVAVLDPKRKMLLVKGVEA